MTIVTEIKAADDRELVITRLIDAPRELVYRCWTDAELMKKWFAPSPWTTPEAKLDVRAGGANRIVMRSPEDYPNLGVYLEVVPNEKLVFTDAFTGGCLRQAVHGGDHHLRGCRRPDPLHGACPPLVRRGSRRARKDGLSPGLGPMRHPARKGSQATLKSAA